MLAGAEVAREAPPQGTGPDAGPRIANAHAHLHPSTQGGVNNALHTGRPTLVPWQWRQDGRPDPVLSGTTKKIHLVDRSYSHCDDF